MSQARVFISGTVSICDACIRAIRADLEAWLGYIQFRVENYQQDDAMSCARCQRTPPHLSIDCTCGCDKCKEGKCADCEHRKL